MGADYTVRGLFVNWSRRFTALSIS
jgi:hypothetical protein